MAASVATYPNEFEAMGPDTLELIKTSPTSACRHPDFLDRVQALFDDKKRFAIPTVREYLAIVCTSVDFFFSDKRPPRPKSLGDIDTDDLVDYVHRVVRIIRRNSIGLLDLELAGWYKEWYETKFTTEGSDAVSQQDYVAYRFIMRRSSLKHELAPEDEEE